jgi:UDP-N-acetylmuramoyl-L-alanyl-D-glutamate--2,6-diaminopimelate ligase
LPLTGRFNVENALAALAAVLVSGACPSNALDGLAAVTPAPGRLERIPTGERGFTLLVDYAHTEDALANVCETLRAGLAGSGPPDRRGRLIVVFGAGGERDPGKRAPMGAAVGRLADLAIVTSDNPRGEDPERIIADVCAGMRETAAERLIEPDRARAIRAALGRARPGDVVLLAGKGHESTQTIGGEARAFDDRQVAKEALA